MPTIEQQLADAIKSQNDLTQSVALYKSQIDRAVADQKAAYDGWKAGLKANQVMGETRHVQEIKIMGSPDFFYPVWWSFPGNWYPGAKLTVSRHYGWDGGSGTADAKLRNVSDWHIAALLLELEGNATPWSGDANFMQIKRFHERYNSTVSHVQFAGYSLRKPVDASKPVDYGEDGVNYCYSTVYLRGGGLTYYITSNWEHKVGFQDGSAGTKGETNLHQHSNTMFYVKPIPFADRKAPVVG